MFVREIYIGSEHGYACRISRAVFGEYEFGGRAKARKAALSHCHAILRQQTADGVPVNASVKERRKLYRKSPSCGQK